MKKIILTFLLVLLSSTAMAQSAWSPRWLGAFGNVTLDGNLFLEDAQSTLSLYVSTTGSDSNDCSSTAKCLTIQKALNKVGASLVSGNVVVYVADGTYAENLVFPSFLGKGKDTTYGNSLITLQGNETTPANVRIKPSSGSIITMLDTRASLRGVRVQGSSSSTTQAGIITFRSKVFWKNTELINLGTGIQLNESSFALYESGSTVGQTFIGAGSGNFFSLGSNSSMTLASSATIIGGSGTTTLVGVTTSSRFLTNTAIALNLFGGAATSTGLLGSNNSNLTLQGNLRIEDITATATTYKTATIRLVTSSSFFISGSRNLNMDNIGSSFYLYQSSHMQASTPGPVATYTNITDKWMYLCPDCTFDSPDTFDPPATIVINREPSRNNTDPVLRSPISASPSISSDSTLLLDSTGNSYSVTGTTTINRITTTNLYNDLILLNFTDSVTVTNASTAVGTSKPIYLTGAANFSATNDDLLVLFYDRNLGVWREITRSVR